MTSLDIWVLGSQVSKGNDLILTFQLFPDVNLLGRLVRFEVVQVELVNLQPQVGRLINQHDGAGAHGATRHGHFDCPFELIGLETRIS